MLAKANQMMVYYHLLILDENKPMHNHFQRIDPMYVKDICVKKTEKQFSHNRQMKKKIFIKLKISSINQIVYHNYLHHHYNYRYKKN